MCLAGDDTTRLTCVMELPRTPVRGDRVTVPGGPRPLVVERTVLHARPATGWTPGIVATPRVEVELAAEACDGLDVATERGWQPVVVA